MTLFVLLNLLYPINEKKEKILIYVFGVLFIFLFGLRDSSVGFDTGNYIDIILGLYKYRFFESNDIGFIVLAASVFFTTNSVQAVFFVIACFYILPLIKVFSTLEIQNKFLLFFLLINLMSFESLGMNIIRQGVAISLSLLAFQKYNQNKIKYSIILFLIAISFHISTFLLIFFFIISNFIKKPTIPLIILIISSILSFLNFDLEPILKLVPFLGSDYEERIIQYNELDNSLGEIYKTGFRIDFFLFNWLFILIGLYLYYFNFTKNYKFYLPILYTFMFSSSFFFLKFNQIYSDRFGVFAWILIPFIFIPLVENKILYGKIYTLILCLILLLLF
jgi:EpsG family